MLCLLCHWFAASFIREFFWFTVDGHISDTVADEVLDKLRSCYKDELFDLEKLIPHLKMRNIITEHDIRQIECQSTQAAKVQLLFNAVKNKGQRSTRLSLLYCSIYDSHEAEFGHGKHYDALGILAKEGMAYMCWIHDNLVINILCLDYKIAMCWNE